jgi:hypothetical protein
MLPVWIPNLRHLQIETHCSERRFGWRQAEFSGGISDCSSAVQALKGLTEYPSASCGGYSVWCVKISPLPQRI